MTILKKFFTASLVIFLLVGCDQSSIQKFSEKTSEECIQDQECFWFAFQRYTNIEKTKKLVRWEKPIKFILIGANKMKIVDAYTKNLDLITSSFPYDFVYDNNLNLLFIITDDPQNIRTFYRQSIINNFGPKLYDALQKNISESTIFEQAYLEMPNGERLGGVQVVKGRRNDSDANTPYYLMDSLGFTASQLDHKKFLFDSLDKGDELNRLHLLLVKSLYDLRLKPGMSLNDVENIFPQIYADLVK